MIFCITLVIGFYTVSSSISIALFQTEENNKKRSVQKLIVNILLIQN